MTRKPYQDSDEWREERRGGYGASDAPILVEGDEAAWQQLHGEKLGIVPGRTANEAMEWGKRLEATIASAYSERIGTPLKRVNKLVRHPEYPYIFASLDRMRYGTIRRPVEIKKWGFKSDAFGPEGSDTVPTSWLYQVQQQMAVTGADAVDIAVLFAGSKLESFTVGRDDGLIAEVVGLEVAAWAFVQRGEMPPWPGQAPKRIIIAEDEVEVDEALLLAVDEYEDAKQDADLAEQWLEGIKERVRTQLADHAGAKGVLPDGRRVTIAYRPQDRTYVDWHEIAKAYRHWIENGNPGGFTFDAIESMYTKQAPTRPLRITIGKDTK